VQKATASFAVDGDRIDIHTDLAAIDSCNHAAILVGLAEHLGYEGAPLMKAVRRKPAQVDPRYPALRTLIKQARTNWRVWGSRLVKEVQKRLRSGDLLPMTAKSEKVLRDLFAEHEVGIALSFGGQHSNKKLIKRLVDEGAISSDYADRALTTLAYKTGRGLEALSVHRVKKDQTPTLAEVLKEAARTKLTAQDRHAIDYAQRRAAIYMRRPATEAHTEITRQLTEAERWAVSKAVVGAIEGQKSQTELARDLEEATKDTTLLNDMDRVARTELHFAHAHGAYVGLKEQAERAGDDDPMVYKIVGGDACEHCKRIWGPASNPSRYRLSFIEQREAQGGNFRRPARDWGPVIGPVHPHCREAALLYWNADLHEAILESAAEMKEWYGD
jgi:hypothetical protein